jgi:threonine synthase
VLRWRRAGSPWTTPPGRTRTNAYVCSACGHREPVRTAAWRCRCGHHFSLDAAPRFEPQRLPAATAGPWRYRHALALPPGVEPVSLGEPATPLLAVDLDGARPHVKLDYLFPTGSYKDRGATVLVSLLRAAGVTALLEDSSGNAGAAIAAYGAAAGIACDIYAPATASAGKLLQIEATGARVHRIPGSREDVTAAALEASARIYYASHYWNPFFNEGTKTLAFELWEQLGDAPDAIVVPCGHGSVALGAARGFAELRTAGVTDHVPRLLAVQAAACAPLHRMFHEGLPAVPEVPAAATAAEGIASRRPLRWREILDAVRGSGGTILAVSEAAIAGALGWAARRGLFVEPTAAASIAGYRAALAGGAVRRDERVVIVLTGHGLKSPEKIAALLHAGEGASRP